MGRSEFVAQMVKNPLARRENWVRSLGWEDSPGEGKGYPLQYSGLENSMDYIVHGGCKELEATEQLSQNNHNSLSYAELSVASTPSLGSVSEPPVKFSVAVAWRLLCC